MNKKLLELLQKYPNAEIYPFTSYEVICDDWGFWLGEIAKVYYGTFYEYNEKIYFDKGSLYDENEDIEEFDLEMATKKEGIIIKIGS